MTVYDLVKQGHTPKQIQKVALDMKKKGETLWGWAEYESQHFPKRRLVHRPTVQYTRPPVVSLRAEAAPAAEWVKKMGVRGVPNTYVEVCMHYLSPRQQKVLYWHYCHGWTYREIAKLWHTIPSIVESIESTAREELADVYPIVRKMLEEDV